MSHSQDHLAYGQYNPDASRGEGESMRGLVGDTFKKLRETYKTHQGQQGGQGQPANPGYQQVSSLPVLYRPNTESNPHTPTRAPRKTTPTDLPANPRTLRTKIPKLSCRTNLPSKINFPACLGSSRARLRISVLMSLSVWVLLSTHKLMRSTVSLPNRKPRIASGALRRTDRGMT